jgi:hypothetical protein
MDWRRAGGALATEMAELKPRWSIPGGPARWTRSALDGEVQGRFEELNGFLAGGAGAQVLAGLAF